MKIKDNKNHFTVFPLLLAISVSGFAQDDKAGKIELGAGAITPAVETKAFYDDNLLSAPSNEEETFGAIISPDVMYEISDNIRRFQAKWRLDAGFHEGSPEDDYVDNRVNAGFEYQPSRRFFAAVHGAYIDTRDPRGTGRAEAVAAGAVAQEQPDEWHSWDINGTLAYGLVEGMARLEFDGGYVSKEYDNNRAFTFVRDRDDTSGAARFFYRIAPKTQALLEGRVLNYQYDEDAPGAPGLDSTVNTAFVGLTWEATFKTTGFAKVGYMEKNFDSSRRQDGDDFSWEVGIEWRPKTYSIVNFATSRAFQETNGAGDFISHDEVSVSWVHGWTDYVSSTAHFLYGENNFDPSVRKDDLINAGVRLDYALRRWMTVGAGYRYDERDSNDDAFDYDRNIFEITLRLTL